MDEKKIKDMTEEEKQTLLEESLLKYVVENAKEPQPEIAKTIPAVANTLIELWKNF